MPSQFTLVERLRQLAPLLSKAETGTDAGFEQLINAGADEIEKLRKMNQKLLELNAALEARVVAAEGAMQEMNEFTARWLSMMDAGIKIGQSGTR